MSDISTDIKYIRICINEWNKILKIVRVNANVLQILYEKLLLLNDCETFTFGDLFDYYFAEFNMYNKPNLDKLIEDIQFSKGKIENFSPKYSSSQVIRTVSANVLNRYLFNQENKIESCLIDIITSMNKFKTHIIGISKLVSMYTVNINRNTNIALDFYELICKLYLTIKLDYDTKLNKFSNLFQDHTELKCRYRDIEYRNCYFSGVLNQLRNEKFDNDILENIIKRLVESQLATKY